MAHIWIKCEVCGTTIRRCRCPGPVTGYDICASCKANPVNPFRKDD